MSRFSTSSHQLTQADNEKENQHSVLNNFDFTAIEEMDPSLGNTYRLIHISGRTQVDL
jgi:hypothetical protein